MRILVVGTGAVGGYFAARLVQAGFDTTLVARGEHADAIRRNGLVVDVPDGQIVARVPVLESVSAARGLGVDVAFVAVKAPALAEVAAATGDALAPTGVAIPLLNGLDSELELAATIGQQHVIGAITEIAAERVGPGRIRVGGGGTMSLAPLDEARLPEVERLATRLSAAFPCRARSNLRTLLWRKLLWNAPFNAICALTGKPAGAVLAVPELERLVRAAMQEVIAVGRADGADLGDGRIDDLLKATRDKFSDSVPSMLQDVRAGRATETDALQGAVVERGRRYGIATPILATLHALMRGLDGRDGA